MTDLFRRLAPSVAATVVALMISGLVIALAGRSPVLAFSALIDGALGSAYGLSEVAVKACPLLITGLAVAVAFRAGVWNIGAEGQLLIGATVMATLGSRTWPLPAWLALGLSLVAAAGGGAAWAAAAGWLRVRRDVNEVISTIMLNFIALGIISYLVHGPLQEAAATYPQSDAVVAALRLPRVPGGARLHAGVLLAVIAAGACTVLLFRTVLGFQMRAVGLNAEAARLGGARPQRCLLLALVISGGLAGLAGAIEVSAITYRLYERLSPGWGFTAIAVALLGRLHPAGIVAAALLFGALEAGSNSMQRVADVSAVLVDVIQATVILCMLAVEQRTGWLRWAR